MICATWLLPYLTPLTRALAIPTLFPVFESTRLLPAAGPLHFLAVLSLALHVTVPFHPSGLREAFPDHLAQGSPSRRQHPRLVSGFSALSAVFTCLSAIPSSEQKVTSPEQGLLLYSGLQQPAAERLTHNRAHSLDG